MNEEPTLELMGQGRGRGLPKRNSGILIGCLTILVAAAVFFCELHLSAAPTEQTAVTACVMLLCCFVMYTSLYDAGHARASEGDGYQKTLGTYESLREQVRTIGDPAALERFCSHYAEEELFLCRSRMLLYAGVDMTTFQRWQNGEMETEEYGALPKEKRRAIKRAARLKPLKLSAFRLLSGATGTRRQLLLSTRPRRIRRTTTALLPTMVGCLVTVSVTVEGVAMTPALIALGLLRLFAILWTGVRGYATGSASVKEDDTLALQDKITLLKAFLTSCSG